MAEELKACPFCGGIPKTSHRPESEASGGGHVAFVVCYCGGYASTAHQMGHAETVQAAIAEVVEKWNTRALPPGQVGEAVAEYQQLSRYNNWDRIDKAAFDLGKLGSCPERFRALYTRPADQVADDLTMVKVSRELLERTAGALLSGPILDGVTLKTIMHQQDKLREELRALLGVKPWP